MKRVVTVAILAFVPLPAFLACGKTQGSAAPAQETVAAPSAVASASAKPAPVQGAPSSWRGTYTSSAGALYIPDELKVRWKAEDTSSGLGGGPLSLTVDPARGVVEGTLGGPLGPAKVNGYVADGGLSATVVRSDPADRGYTGVLVGSVASDRVAGTFNLSPATGGAVRAGTFEMTAAGGEASH